MTLAIRTTGGVSRPLQVCLAHGGIQYSYKVASALAEEQMLQTFYTTLHVGQGSLLGRLLKLCADKETGFTRLLCRRRVPTIAENCVQGMPWFELLERLMNRISSRRFQHELLTLRNAAFDRWTASRIERDNERFDVFYGFSGSCLCALRCAKGKGKVAILDHHDVHHQTARKLIEEELELNPDFASTMCWPPYEPYLNRVDEEINEASHHITLSSFARTTYLKEGIEPQRVSVVPLGVDLSHFTRRRSSERENIRQVFRVVFVGTLTQRKGIKYLLEAMKQLRLPSSELILAGGPFGPDKPFAKYRDTISQLGYVESEGLPDLLGSCDLLVLPSVYDSFGQVIVEAMACGLPVVVSGNTAGADVVREGVDGFIVPIRDVEAIKERIERLYIDKELRVWMGQNAACQARNFSTDAYRNRLLSVLQMVRFGSD